MSGHCDHHVCDSADVSRFRWVLWVCLIANAGMFVAQMVASYWAHSVALLANSLDFLSDAANYGISLFVLHRSLKTRATASMVKGISLGLVGLWTAYEVIHHSLQPELPQPMVMTVVSIVALLVNIGCASLLYRYREGDSNTESLWICSRNDAIGNIAVMLAAAGVVATSTIWPDIGIASLLAYLALSGAWQIIRVARRELRGEDASDSK